MLVPLWTAPSSAPERRHEAGAGNPTDAPLFERKHEMGVNGATDVVTNAILPPGILTRFLPKR